MTKKEKEVGYFKAHTTEVEINGIKHRVATLYLDNLKKSLGKKVIISKDEQSAADKYLKDIEERSKESAKVTAPEKK